MTQTLALIDYGSGNVHSAHRALVAAAEGAGVAVDVHLTHDPDYIRKADRIVLPGVGHFKTCMEDLTARTGVVEALNTAMFGRAVPFLGICVGMQILAETGTEGTPAKGLGWLSGRVEALPQDNGLVMPHMGWNSLKFSDEPHPLMQGLGVDPHVYFVHSYAMQTEAKNIIAECEYGTRFVAAIATDNIAGVQFHPEKSQKTGQHILQNFLEWQP